MKTKFTIGWDGLVAICLATLLWSFSGIFASAGEIPRRLTIDSVEFNSYKALLNEIRETTYMRKTLEMVIYKDNREMTRDSYEWIGLHDFCDGETPSGCYLKDINGDGIGEVILRGIGEGNRFDMAVIYSLGDTASELARFEEISGFYINDLDGDSIPELIFQDNSFVGMYIETIGAPRPTVIWRWEDGRYKIANFKYSEFLLGEFEKRFPEDSIKTMDQYQTNFGIPQGKFQYQRYLFNYLVNYFFAGRYDKAWSVYQRYLPKELPIRKHARFYLMSSLGLYWEAMEESNKLPVDSLIIDDYRIIIFHNLSGDNKPIGFYNDVGIYRGSDSLAYHPNSVHSFDNVGDINKDGITELVIREYTGGASCCCGGYIYSFGDTLALLLRIEPGDGDFYYKDVDSDSVLEDISYDYTFYYWNDGRYLPRLIWAWNGRRYSIRNFHYPEIILEAKGEDILESVRVPSALSEESSDFEGNWGRIILLAYAGKLAAVDSLLAAQWPTAAAEQKKAYDLFKRTLEADSNWKELLESDW